MPGSAAVPISARKSPPVDTDSKPYFSRRTIVGEKEYEHVLDIATPHKEAPRRSIAPPSPINGEDTPDTKRLQMTRRITEEEKAKLRVPKLPADLPGRYPKNISNLNSATKPVLSFEANDSQKENIPANGVVMNMPAVHKNASNDQPFKHISNERLSDEKSSSPNSLFQNFSSPNANFKKQEDVESPKEKDNPFEAKEPEKAGTPPFAFASQPLENITQPLKIIHEASKPSVENETQNSDKPTWMRPVDKTK